MKTTFASGWLLRELQVFAHGQLYARSSAPMRPVDQVARAFRTGMPRPIHPDGSAPRA